MHERQTIETLHDARLHVYLTLVVVTLTHMHKAVLALHVQHQYLEISKQVYATSEASCSTYLAQLAQLAQLATAIHQ
jgi:hypothetical protein